MKNFVNKTFEMNRINIKLLYSIIIKAGVNRLILNAVDSSKMFANYLRADTVFLRIK